MNRLQGCGQLIAGQLKARRTDTGIPLAGFLLYELDELHEFRHRVEPKQRQKPSIELERLRGLSSDSAIKKIDRFSRQRVGEAGDPSRCPDANRFEDRVIDANEDR